MNVKAIHDLKNAIMRLKTFKKMVATGFDFSSKEGEAYLALVDEGIATIEAMLGKGAKDVDA